jgi:HPt (histidine-containing phosphotransfer) domain-containing protein
VALDALLDEHRLEQLRALGTGARPGFLTKLVTLYVGDSEKHLAAIRLAVESGASDKLREAAHALKSGSRTIGAARVSNLCERLERLGKAQTLAGAEHLAGNLAVALAETVAALRGALEPRP